MRLIPPPDRAMVAGFLFRHAVLAVAAGLPMLPGNVAFAGQESLLRTQAREQGEIIDQQTAPVAATTVTLPTQTSETAPVSAAHEGDQVAPTSPELSIPPERIYSAGRRAEPRLWELLNAARYAELEQEIRRLRAEDPAWTPPDELLSWLGHHLAAPSKPRVGRAPAPRVERKKPVVDAYGTAVTAAARLQRAHRTAAALARLQPWERAIVKRRDAGASELLGWLHLSADEHAAALQDFRRAGRWRPAPNPARGELLALERLGLDRELEETARQHAARWPELRETAAGALRALATQRHRDGDYARAERLLVDAATLSAPDRDARLLTAWNAFQLEQWPSAADQFSILYQEAPDTPSAEGLLLSLKKQNDRARLAVLAQEPGPLQELWQQELAREDYAAKRFLAAHATSANQFPSLRNIDSASLFGGLSGRWRSGDAGMGRLEEWSVPLAADDSRNGRFSARVELEQTRLDSGALAPGQAVGSPALTSGGTYPFAPTTTLNDALQWQLTLRWEDRLTPYLRLGMTPTGGALSPRLHGALGVEHTGADSAWRISAHALPMRESLLSYTGIRDPYTGDAWGQVWRQGIELQGWRTVAPDWTLAGLLRADAYRGDGVADNSGAEINLALGRDLGLPGFAYFNLGPVLDYRTFERNLNHFTRGHGGYYSPQQDIGLALSLTFQTDEGRSWLARGQVHGGWRRQNQDASPWFPLAPDSRRFSAVTQTGFSGGIGLEGILRLAGHWQLGGALAYDDSPGFEQGGGSLFLRYLFEPRPAVFSSDLGSPVLDD